MDIKIEAPGHPNQSKLMEFYHQKLSRKYQKYEFIKTIHVSIKKDDDKNYEVSLKLLPERSSLLFSKHSNPSENQALYGAIRKMNSQLDKYKEQRYHSANRYNKDEVFYND